MKNHQQLAETLRIILPSKFFLNVEYHHQEVDRTGNQRLLPTVTKVSNVENTLLMRNPGV